MCAGESSEALFIRHSLPANDGGAVENYLKLSMATIVLCFGLEEYT